MAVMPGYHSDKRTNPTRTTAANSCTLPAAFRQARQRSGGILGHSATETNEEEVKRRSGCMTIPSVTDVAHACPRPNKYNSGVGTEMTGNLPLCRGNWAHYAEEKMEGNCKEPKY
ncbi:hypothetical protein GBF38_019640 [Nibea albiflora]|uniref:Uncharacterized protein n=1 Tax=Nibea albiflora TaxID=240163 RepID=A0ACB7F2C4_NIBAL|nr:hypothetical protein GBF38_019640 [Nibea albiflora]